MALISVSFDYCSRISTTTLIIMTAQEFFHHMYVFGPGPGPKTSRWCKILVSICLYCLNCTKFCQLILRTIITIIATRCQILKLKCTKFDFGWGLQRSQTP